jgi:hypothetical protein
MWEHKDPMNTTGKKPNLPHLDKNLGSEDMKSWNLESVSNHSSSALAARNNLEKTGKTVGSNKSYQNL